MNKVYWKVKKKFDGSHKAISYNIIVALIEVVNPNEGFGKS